MSGIGPHFRQFELVVTLDNITENVICYDFPQIMHCTFL